MGRRYWLRRLAWALPTLVLISISIFLISRGVPGDPVLLLLGDRLQESETRYAPTRRFESRYNQVAARYGLDLPLFYVSWRSLAERDHTDKIVFLPERSYARRLLYRQGDWTQVSRWLEVKRSVREYLRTHEERILLDPVWTRIDTVTDPALLLSLVKDTTARWRASVPHALLSGMEQEAVSLQDKSQLWKTRVPYIAWHGTDNQFHRWVSGWVSGDFGTSYRDQRPVSAKVADALEWTLLLNLIALPLIVIGSILVGGWSAFHAGRLSERIVHTVLTILFVVPVFLLGLLLLLVFTSKAYLGWLPGPGDLPWQMYGDAWSQWAVRLEMLLLPVLCLVLTSLASLSRQVRNLLLQELQKGYVEAGLLRGIAPKRLLWRYALPNAFVPLSAQISRLVPALISGALVLEVIFNIPGMGRLTFESLYARDWPVLFTLLFAGALLSVLGALLADLVMYWLDPGIRRQMDMAPHKKAS